MCQHCECHQDRGSRWEGRGSRGGCGCGECDCEGPVHHHEQTRAEQITDLETHLNELKAELQAAEERLTDLRK